MINIPDKTPSNASFNTILYKEFRILILINLYKV